MRDPKSWLVLIMAIGLMLSSGGVALADPTPPPATTVPRSEGRSTAAPGATVQPALAPAINVTVPTVAPAPNAGPQSINATAPQKKADDSVFSKVGNFFSGVGSAGRKLADGAGDGMTTVVRNMPVIGGAIDQWIKLGDVGRGAVKGLAVGAAVGAAAVGIAAAAAATGVGVAAAPAVAVVAGVAAMAGTVYGLAVGDGAFNLGDALQWSATISGFVASVIALGLPLARKLFESKLKKILQHPAISGPLWAVFNAGDSMFSSWVTANVPFQTSTGKAAYAMSQIGFAALGAALALSINDEKAAWAQTAKATAAAAILAGVAGSLIAPLVKKLPAPAQLILHAAAGLAGTVVASAAAGAADAAAAGLSPGIGAGVAVVGVVAAVVAPAVLKWVSEPVRVLVVEPVRKLVYEPIKKWIVEPVMERVLIPVQRTVLRPVRVAVVRAVTRVVLTPVTKVVRIGSRWIAVRVMTPIRRTFHEQVWTTVMRPVVTTVLEPMWRKVMKPVLKTILMPVWKTVNTSVWKTVMRPVRRLVRQN